jgi:hypothetical protein
MVLDAYKVHLFLFGELLSLLQDKSRKLASLLLITEKFSTQQFVFTKLSGNISLTVPSGIT